MPFPISETGLAEHPLLLCEVVQGSRHKFWCDLLELAHTGLAEENKIAAFWYALLSLYTIEAARARAHPPLLL